MENKIGLVIESLKVLQKTIHDEPKTVEIIAKNEEERVKIVLRRNEIGTYRDDNTSKLGNLLRIGQKIDFVEGELGYAIGTGKQSYYCPTTYILTDESTIEKVLSREEQEERSRENHIKAVNSYLETVLRPVNNFYATYEFKDGKAKLTLSINGQIKVFDDLKTDDELIRTLFVEIVEEIDKNKKEKENVGV